MRLFERKLLSPITEHLNNERHTIITGSRQTGKTTLLNQIHSRLNEKGEVTHAITMEDPFIRTRLDEHPENIFELIPRPEHNRIFLLIDEIQLLKDPSNFLKLLYDSYTDRLKIVATGSSAFYIDTKFKDSLAGRKRIFELYTLDFDEFLVFKNRSKDLIPELERIRNEPRYVSLHRNEIRNLFSEYLTWGGYPAVVLANSDESRKELLKELTGSFLKRDIFESRIQEENKFIRLLMILAGQTGSLVNYHELSRTLRLSVTAVESYIYILRKCFHIHLLPPFYQNIRKELIKMPKVYFHDHGFRNTLLNFFAPPDNRPDKGALLENYVFIRLRQKYGTDALRYWRTADGNEIDFIVEESYLTGQAIEVKSQIQSFNPKKLSRFAAAYPGFSIHGRAFAADNNANDILAL